MSLVINQAHAYAYAQVSRKVPNWSPIRKAYRIDRLPPLTLRYLRSSAAANQNAEVKMLIRTLLALTRRDNYVLCKCYAGDPKAKMGTFRARWRTMEKMSVVCSSSRKLQPKQLLKCQLKVYSLFRASLAATWAGMFKADMKSFIFRCALMGRPLVAVDMTMMEKPTEKQPQSEISISNNDGCFCSSLVAFVVKLFTRLISNVLGPQKSVDGETPGRNKRKWWNGVKAGERKAGSVAYLHRDDGMYHLKVINLKISRERRREARQEEKKFAYRFHLNSNKSHSRSGRSHSVPRERKKKRIVEEIGTSLMKMKISPFSDSSRKAECFMSSNSGISRFRLVWICSSRICLSRYLTKIRCRVYHEDHQICQSIQPCSAVHQIYVQIARNIHFPRNAPHNPIYRAIMGKRSERKWFSKVHRMHFSLRGSESFSAHFFRCCNACGSKSGNFKSFLPHQTSDVSKLRFWFYFNILIAAINNNLAQTFLLTFITELGNKKLLKSQ